ncbi:MAG: DnaD domain protein [Ruminococcaceae bacterium]|nr:DnaD domain protein [Oscillospiraceae bacterium]
MNIQNLTIESDDLRKLLATASGDAALLYLSLRCGNTAEEAAAQLQFTPTRLSCAGATLRQLGLWAEPARPAVIAGERPVYSEKDVLEAMDTSNDFRLLYGEVQRLLGRSLNTEELKILLSFVHYLGLPTEVISVLVSYCKDRAKQRGSLRNPSLRTIEKEAFHWAEAGIDTLEAAGAYIQSQNFRASRLHELMNTLQIRGRNLTPAEERYALSWLDMGFPMDVIAIAYERTCLNTGGMSWPYMNKILQSWNESGFKTPDQVRSGDRKSGTQNGSRQLDADEQAAIAKMLQGV